MTGNRKETGGISLLKISVDKFKLDASYSRGKEVKSGDAGYNLVYIWNVSPLDDECDKLKMTIELELYRIKDRFSIVKMSVSSIFRVTKGVTFRVKVNMLNEAYNSTVTHVQGVWKLKVYNVSLAKYLVQAYNKILQDEQELEKSIYEDWV
jgi:hypothetical protein